MKDMKIGFIGQGFIGKNMADDFMNRGYSVVRYSLESEYSLNRDQISVCDIVFVAVPTPTTKLGFDSRAIISALSLIGKGKTAVIKSTLVPGFTRSLQTQFPEITIIHSPEFLREKFAAEDTRSPERTIIGVAERNSRIEEIIKTLLDILPKAEKELICTYEEAELIKYGGNCFLAMKVVYMNLVYNFSQVLNADYDIISSGIGSDKRIGMSHMKVIDSSGTDTVAGRGAGGHCFPKDLAAFRKSYEALVKDDEMGGQLLRVLEEKNIDLLRGSNKDIELLNQIYDIR